MKLKILFIATLLLSAFVSCASSTAIKDFKSENFSTTGNARTFDIQVYNTLGARRTELNLEHDSTPRACQYHFLFSVTWVPVVNDPIAVAPGGSLEIGLGKMDYEYVSSKGSREDTVQGPLGLGKQETIRFENIPHRELEAILENGEATYLLKGRNDSVSGKIPAGSMSVLKEFYEKTRAKCK